MEPQARPPRPRIPFIGDAKIYGRSSLMETMSLLQARFTAFNTIRERKNYTIYEIELKSSSTMSWVIYKRYSEFYHLHQELCKAFPTVMLPTIPPKRIAGSLAHGFVEKRMEDLQFYLSTLLRISDIVRSDLLLAFISVPESVRPMIAKRPRLPESSSDHEREPHTVIRRNLNREERKVYDLVEQLSPDYPSKVAAIKSYEKYFFEQKPKLSDDIISILFRGTQEAGCGLIHTCGSFVSQAAARSALKLVHRLLDTERNTYANTYLKNIVRAGSKLLYKMALHRHILVDQNRDAFHIVAAIHRRYPRLPLDEFLPDTIACDRFLTWMERSKVIGHISSSGLIQKFNNTAKLPETQYHSLIAAAQHELCSLSRLDQGWTFVSHNKSNAIQIVYRQGTVQGITLLRVGLVLPAAPKDVMETLLDLKKRNQWDIKFSHGSVLKRVDDHIDVTHEVYDSFGSMYKKRDLVLLRSKTVQEDGTCIITEQSIPPDDIEESQYYSHASIKPSGFVLSPHALDTASSGTLLIRIAQLDPEAVLIYTPDILGETDQLVSSYETLASSLC